MSVIVSQTTLIGCRPARISRCSAVASPSRTKVSSSEAMRQRGRLGGPFGDQPKRRAIPPKANSAFVAAMEDVLAVYTRPRDSPFSLGPVGASCRPHRTARPRFSRSRRIAMIGRDDPEALSADWGSVIRWPLGGGYHGRLFAKRGTD
jgi:hypothetical protein